jgi:hypothetical protein
MDHFTSTFTRIQETDEAFVRLQRAFEQRSLWLGYLNVKPQLDRLRSDQRFQALLRRVGLLNRSIRFLMEAT